MPTPQEDDVETRSKKADQVSKSVIVVRPKKRTPTPQEDDVETGSKIADDGRHPAEPLESSDLPVGEDDDGMDVESISLETLEGGIVAGSPPPDSSNLAGGSIPVDEQMARMGLESAELRRSSRKAAEKMKASNRFLAYRQITGGKKKHVQKKAKFALQASGQMVSSNKDVN
jgi:hypothetical protein